MSLPESEEWKMSTKKGVEDVHCLPSQVPTD